jgi:hypothetical protein
MFVHICHGQKLEVGIHRLLPPGVEADSHVLGSLGWCVRRTRCDGSLKREGALHLPRAYRSQKRPQAYAPLVGLSLVNASVTPTSPPRTTITTTTTTSTIREKKKHTNNTLMAPPTALAIKTSAVVRLIKEEAMYHKELVVEEQRLSKMSADGDGDEYALKQQVPSPHPLPLPPHSLTYHAAHSKESSKRQKRSCRLSVKSCRPL